MIDAREEVKEALQANAAVTAVCPAANIHIVRAGRDNKDFPRICIIENDNAPAVTADNQETASAVRFDLWMWDHEMSSLAALCNAVNQAMRAIGFRRGGAGPDGYVIGPDVFEKMLWFQGTFQNPNN